MLALGLGATTCLVALGTVFGLAQKEGRKIKGRIYSIERLYLKEHFISGTPWDHHNDTSLALEYISQYDGSSEYINSNEQLRRYLSKRGYPIFNLESEVLKLRKTIKDPLINDNRAIIKIAEGRGELEHAFGDVYTLIDSHLKEDSFFGGRK